MDIKNFSKISGIVIHGDGYGRKLGFPTVNLEIDKKSKTEALPPSGVYAGNAILEGKAYKAGIVIGSNENQNKVEAHIIGFTGDAYGKIVDLEIKKFIREYKNFNTEEELIAQIQQDINLITRT